MQFTNISNNVQCVFRTRKNVELFEWLAFSALRLFTCAVGYFIYYIIILADKALLG